MQQQEEEDSVSPQVQNGDGLSLNIDLIYNNEQSLTVPAMASFEAANHEDTNSSNDSKPCKVEYSSSSNSSPTFKSLQSQSCQSSLTSSCSMNAMNGNGQRMERKVNRKSVRLNYKKEGLSALEVDQVLDELEVRPDSLRDSSTDFRPVFSCIRPIVCHKSNTPFYAQCSTAKLGYCTWCRQQRRGNQRQGSICLNCGERLTAKYHRWYPHLVRLEPLEKTRSKAMYIRYKPVFERFGITWHNEKQFEFVIDHYMLIKIYLSTENFDVGPLHLERTYMIGVFAGREFNTGALARKLLREGSKLAMFRADFPDYYDFLRDERAAVAEQMNVRFFQGCYKCYFHAHYTNIEGWYDPSTISRDDIIETFKELCNTILAHTALANIQKKQSVQKTQIRKKVTFKAPPTAIPQHSQYQTMLNQLSAITPIANCKVKSFQFNNAQNVQNAVQTQQIQTYLPPLATTPRFTVPTPRNNVMQNNINCATPRYQMNLNQINLNQMNMPNNMHLNQMNNIYGNLQIPVSMLKNTNINKINKEQQPNQQNMQQQQQQQQQQQLNKDKMQQKKNSLNAGAAPFLLNTAISPRNIQSVMSPPISPRNFNRNRFVAPQTTTNWLPVPPVFAATSPTNNIMVKQQINMNSMMNQNQNSLFTPTQSPQF